MKWLKWTLLTLVCATSTALAVKTSYWTDDQSTEFKAGKSTNIVISNMNRITLGLQSADLLTGRTDVSIVFDVRALSDGTLLAATGSEGRLMVYRDKKWETLYKADQPYIFAMDIAPDGKIYLGTGGNKGKVVEISADGKQAKELFAKDNVRYIWQVKKLSDGRIVAATGPNGKLFMIDKDGAKEIFSCKQKNLQAMAIGKDGAIYVGTDGEAIIYKIEEKDGKFVSRAFYDASEKEISALLVDEKGFLYAATASGIQGKDLARSYLTKPQGSPVSTQAAKPAAKATTSAPTTTQQASGKKIVKAGKTDKSEAKKPTPGKGPSMPMPSMPMPDMGGGSSSSAMIGQGNAVYRFDSLGFATEIFRDKVDINCMVIDQGILYLGTGPEGWLFKVNPATEEVILLAKTNTKNINDLARTSDGAFILATTSPAKVMQLGPGLAKSGSYTSKVFDARQIARWGMITVTPVNPNAPGCCATVQTRSSQIKNAEDPGWSEWSKPVDIKKPSYITSPSARYLQYRINFTAADQSPAMINQIQIAWMQDNLAPKVTSVTVNTGSNVNKPAAPQGGDDEEGSEMDNDTPPMPPMMKKPGSKDFQVNWKATDPNGDQLRYNLYLRRVNTPYWIELQKDYAMPMFKWDSQTVPDGRYEFKVVASDALANPVGMGLTTARVSDPFYVDNTPPVIQNLECKLIEPGKLLIKADLVDELTEIQSCYVTINGSKDWQYLAPADELYDSKTEKLETVLPVPSENKPLMITLKVTDRNDNVGYGWKIIPTR